MSHDRWHAFTQSEVLNAVQYSVVFSLHWRAVYSAGQYWILARANIQYWPAEYTVHQERKTTSTSTVPHTTLTLIKTVSSCCLSLVHSIQSTCSQYSSFERIKQLSPYPTLLRICIIMCTKRLLVLLLLRPLRRLQYSLH